MLQDGRQLNNQAIKNQELGGVKGVVGGQWTIWIPRYVLQPRCHVCTKQYLGSML